MHVLAALSSLLASCVSPPTLNLCIHVTYGSNMVRTCRMSQIPEDQSHHAESH